MTDTHSAPDLVRVAAEQRVDGDTRAPRVHIDGRVPERYFAPARADEVIAAIDWARDTGGALVPVGGSLSVEQGNLLRAPRFAAVWSGAMAGIYDFSPADMVVTAASGTTLSALQAALAASRQYLPLDPPNPDAATLGGIVATNAQGLWRPAFGSPRDRLLGVRVVLADGSLVRGGGKVVKNVAGYDLCKLFAGSWGTLGFITEVTFKTSPLPAMRRHIAYTAASARQAAAAGLAVHIARLEPLYAVVLDRADSQPVLCIGLQGSAEMVEWQEGAIRQVLADAGMEPLESGPSDDDLRCAISGARCPLKARIATRSSDVPDLAERLHGVAQTAVYHVQTGIVELAAGALAAGNGESALREQVARVGRLASPATPVWTMLPTELKAGLDVWGPTRGDAALMRAMKRALDPQGAFSPGRFIGGI